MMEINSNAYLHRELNHLLTDDEFNAFPEVGTSHLLVKGVFRIFQSRDGRIYVTEMSVYKPPVLILTNLEDFYYVVRTGEERPKAVK